MKGAIMNLFVCQGSASFIVSISETGEAGSCCLKQASSGLDLWLLRERELFLHDTASTSPE